MPEFIAMVAAAIYRPIAMNGKQRNSVSEYDASLIAPIAEPLNLSVARRRKSDFTARRDISHISWRGKLLG